ncbi:cation diffusion facilitator family transporter [Desulfovibrio inopinatus]|uniref:cation diffusion facilitator family transporter n=1 Tax=Desulfovibrio inopinatus TaxID=102109 RepID=UPI000416862D|nr:cation diffusion facilitator family transporter [Desulfovibrio inopinatus]
MTTLHRKRIIAALISAAVGTILVAVKFWAFAKTGSSAILSDALESIINIVAALFALASVIVAAMPPDRNHPYGHGRIEYFSAGFEGSLIILASLGIVWESYDKIFNPQPIPNLDAGLILVVIAGAVNLLLGLFLLGVGKATSSATLEADGKHVLTDVFTSAGVVVGLVLVWFTGWVWLDGAVACLVAVNILFMGVSLVKKSFSRLMDAVDPHLLEEICLVLSKNRRPAWIDIHRLRARRSGNRVQVDFHLILPRNISLDAAYSEVQDMEAVLKNDFHDDIDILIRAEPCRDGSCSRCGQASCGLRAAETVSQPVWCEGPVAADGPMSSS